MFILRVQLHYIHYILKSAVKRVHYMSSSESMIDYGILLINVIFMIIGNQPIVIIILVVNEVDLGDSKIDL